MNDAQLARINRELADLADDERRADACANPRAAGSLRAAQERLRRLRDDLILLDPKEPS